MGGEIFVRLFLGFVCVVGIDFFSRSICVVGDSRILCGFLDFCFGVCGFVCCFRVVRVVWFLTSLWEFVSVFREFVFFVVVSVRFLVGVVGF